MKYLFIDRKHVQRLDGVQQVFHQPVKERQPVVVPDRPWEESRLHIWSAPIWCPERSRWRMWYFAGEDLLPLYAESADGLHWEKPALGLVNWKGSSENNLFDLGFTTRNPKENRIVLLRDDWDPDPTRRFKGLTRVGNHLRALASPDGLRWAPLDGNPILSGDEYRLNQDTLHRRFVATVKLGNRSGRYPVPELGRAVSLSLSEDFVRWSEPELIFWADEIDQEIGKQRIQEAIQGPNRRRPLVVRPDEFVTDVYNMPLFTYEDLCLGLPVMLHQSGAYFHTTGSNQDGILYPTLVASRNLREWDRLSRQPFLPLSPLSDEACWDYGAIHANRPVAHGDELWFYYTGTRFTHLKRELIEAAGLRKSPDEPMGAIFLARLRVDGFASVHAGENLGVVLTKPVRVSGPTLYVNADAAQGELRAEIRDAQTGRAIPGYSLGFYVRDRYVYSDDGSRKALRTGTGARFEDDPSENDTVPICENGTALPVRWRVKTALSDLLGREVRICFALRNAHLYSFWFGE